MLAVLSQVLSIQQSSPQEVASQQGVAVTVDPVAEVLAGDAHLIREALGQLSVINKAPLLHAITASTSVLFQVLWSWQQVALTV